jgi:hypothetical protein
MPGFNLVKVWRAASTIKGGYWIIDILGFVTSKPVGCVVLCNADPFPCHPGTLACRLCGLSLLIPYITQFAIDIQPARRDALATVNLRHKKSMVTPFFAILINGWCGWLA